VWEKRKQPNGSDGAVTKESAAGHTNGSAKGASRVPERKPIKINYSLALKFDDRRGKCGAWRMRNKEYKKQ